MIYLNNSAFHLGIGGMTFTLQNNPLLDSNDHPFVHMENLLSNSEDYSLMMNSL